MERPVTEIYDIMPVHLCCELWQVFESDAIVQHGRCMYCSAMLGGGGLESFNFYPVSTGLAAYLGVLCSNVAKLWVINSLRVLHFMLWSVAWLCEMIALSTWLNLVHFVTLLLKLDTDFVRSQLPRVNIEEVDKVFVWLSLQRKNSWDHNYRQSVANRIRLGLPARAWREALII